MLPLPSPPGQAPRPGCVQRTFTCSLMWHTARFCSSQEQDTRMYFSQFPAPPWPASAQNFSVPRASGICGERDRTGVSWAQRAATEGEREEKGLQGTAPNKKWKGERWVMDIIDKETCDENKIRSQPLSEGPGWQNLQGHTSEWSMSKRFRTTNILQNTALVAQLK